jgi:hypothetical protein
MKVLQVLFLAALFGVSLSSFTQPKHVCRHCETKLYGLFDFASFHGGGSGKEELDEQWELQQQILANRKGHGTKEHRQKKYRPKDVEQESADRATNRAKVAKQQEAEDKPKSKQKFFWEK